MGERSSEHRDISMHYADAQIPIGQGFHSGPDLVHPVGRLSVPDVGLKPLVY